MSKIVSFFTSIAVIFSYLFGFSAPAVSAPAKIENEKRLVGISALYAGQGISADEDYYYTSGSLFVQKSGFGLQFLAKWTADGYKKVKVNYSPIPSFNKKTYGCGHIGGISVYDGRLYAAVEGTDYSINFIYVYNTDDLSLLKVYNVSCDLLDDGIPWVAVDGENGYVYCSRWGDTDKLLKFNLSDMSFAGTVTLSQNISRIQGGEFYNGKLYLSRDNPHSTEETVYCVDVSTGEISTFFTLTMTSSDNESEDLAIYPRKDGSLFHILNYDKLLGLNIVDCSITEAGEETK